MNISKDDVTTYNGCFNLVKSSNNLGPVHAIFNTAMVLVDAFLENQNLDSFKLCLKPKADATRLLDEISRIYCPQLE